MCTHVLLTFVKNVGRFDFFLYVSKGLHYEKVIEF